MLMVMRLAVCSVLTAILVISGVALDQVQGEEALGHHEHDGVSDAHAEQAGHHHGDSDDHHENPEDPCHHHVVHCCCAHAHAFVGAAFETLARNGAFERLSLPVQLPNIGHYAAPPFHVPIA